MIISLNPKRLISVFGLRHPHPPFKVPSGKSIIKVSSNKSHPKFMYNDGFVIKNYTQHLYLTFTQSYTQRATGTQSKKLLKVFLNLASGSVFTAFYFEKHTSLYCNMIKTDWSFSRTPSPPDVMQLLATAVGRGSF